MPSLLTWSNSESVACLIPPSTIHLCLQNSQSHAGIPVWKILSDHSRTCCPREGRPWLTSEIFPSNIYIAHSLLNERHHCIGELHAAIIRFYHYLMKVFWMLCKRHTSKLCCRCEALFLCSSLDKEVELGIHVTFEGLTPSSITVYRKDSSFSHSRLWSLRLRLSNWFPEKSRITFSGNPPLPRFAIYCRWNFLRMRMMSYSTPMVGFSS